MKYIFINKLSDIDLEKYDNDIKFIKERRFEVILTSFSSSNDYRPLLDYNKTPAEAFTPPAEKKMGTTLDELS